ncbi:hypothetical protein V5F77_15565 [Xanthobacter sp. DSM 24535]|uniref:hypothetical protein n=1 Tax=Roseixanthobacter psychrophilus TaxID=3119917 RepID=UPI00372B11B1
MGLVDAETRGGISRGGIGLAFVDLGAGPKKNVCYRVENIGEFHEVFTEKRLFAK